jgi:hypothetical protein
MPTLRVELEPLRRLVKGGNYAALKAMIEFIDKADEAMKDCATFDNCPGDVKRALALLDQQIE